MSQWTDIRDALREAFDLDEITEEVKQELTRNLLEKALPMAKEYIGAFVERIKEQAATETGWCRIRDSIVLPLSLECAVWLVEQLLTKTVENTIEA